MLEDFEAYHMAKTLYQSCKSIKVPHFLREQLQRASASVVLNLAEGAGKRTSGDQRRYYSIALGSLRECRAILEMEAPQDSDLNRLADRLTAILYVLTKKQPPP
jgi:four helix bundle protein